MSYVEFSKDEEIIVKGPCSIKVIEGNVFIQGLKILDEINIPYDNSFTIYTIDNVSKILLDCNILDKTKNVTNWHKIAEMISATGGTVVILGNIDSGKTYFSNLIANCYKNEVVILDGDVGQSSLFIPTFIALSKSSLKTLNISSRGVSDIEFLGDITPSTNPQLHVNLLRILYERNRSNLNIIDTDGWVRGYRAYLHKLSLLNYINPDYIIILDNELKKYFIDKYNQKIIVPKKPSVVEGRSRERRKMRRRNLYMNYFKDSKEVSIPSSSVFGIGITDILFDAWGETVQLTLEEPCSGIMIDRSELIGLIVGLIRGGKTIGAGLIKEINKNHVKIFSPIEEFDGIVTGKIALDDKFEERRVKLRKCHEL
ncbi:MAG: Clp1/GlmU family protein [Sulfolobaceae archaeon]